MFVSARAMDGEWNLRKRARLPLQAQQTLFPKPYILGKHGCYPEGLLFFAGLEGVQIHPQRAQHPLVFRV